jgi:hypothetical protein
VDPEITLSPLTLDLGGVEPPGQGTAYYQVNEIFDRNEFITIDTKIYFAVKELKMRCAQYIFQKSY